MQEGFGVLARTFEQGQINEWRHDRRFAGAGQFDGWITEIVTRPLSILAPFATRYSCQFAFIIFVSVLELRSARGDRLIRRKRPACDLTGLRQFIRSRLLAGLWLLYRHREEAFLHDASVITS